MLRVRYVAPVIVLAILFAINSIMQVQTVSAALTNARFQRVWERQDLPVALGRANRSWTWGPQALTVEIPEPFVDAQSPEKVRPVQYFDKGRMELNDASGNVSRGLLPVEMILGQIQVGFSTFQQQDQEGAKISVVGDPGDLYPTYADLRSVYQSPGNVAPGVFGKPVTALLNPDKSITSFKSYTGDPGTVLHPASNGHSIPQAFLDFQNMSGLVYENSQFVNSGVFNPALEIFGLPVTEPYWVTTLLNGNPTTVLFQVFERRVLTYNPTNPPRWRVEMGNVGRHYLEWRYGADRPPTPPENEQPGFQAGLLSPSVQAPTSVSPNPTVVTSTVETPNVTSTTVIEPSLSPTEGKKKESLPITPEASPSESPSPNPSPSESPSPNPSPSESPSPNPSPSESPSPNPSPSESPSPNPSPSESPSPTEDNCPRLPDTIQCPRKKPPIFPRPLGSQVLTMPKTTPSTATTLTPTTLTATALPSKP